MKREDLEFLKDLQNELNAQENDYTSDPVFWGIMETKKFPCSEDYAEGCEIYYDGEDYSFSEFKEFILDNYFDEEVDMSELECCTECDDLVGYFNANFGRDARVVYYMEEEILSEKTGAFLTKRAAKEHINNNYYHYHNPKTYAMCGWRNYELEHLIKILKTVDLNKIEVDE